MWIDARYDHPEIIITENGCAFNESLVEGKVDDHERIQFFRDIWQQYKKLSGEVLMSKDILSGP